MDNLEITVRRFVADILELPIDDVSPDDDLLALGGASLEVIELAGRLRDECGVDLDLDTIFEAPSLRAIATAARGSGGDRQAEAPL